MERPKWKLSFLLLVLQLHFVINEEHGILTFPSLLIREHPIYIHQNKNNMPRNGTHHSFNIRYKNDLHTPLHIRKNTHDISSYWGLGLGINIFNKLPVELRGIPDRNFHKKIREILVKDDVDEKYKIDLSDRGRTFISAVQHLRHVLKDCHLVPGKNVELNINPPGGVRVDYGENLYGSVAGLVPGYVQAPDTSYKLVATENSQHFLNDVSVGINCGFMENANIQLPAVQNMLGPFTMNIPSYQDDINSSFTMLLQKAFSRYRGVVCGDKPVGFIIQVRPPQGSNMVYENMLLDSLKRQLKILSPCLLRYTINQKLLRKTDGTIINIEYLINFYRYTSQDVGQFVIDLMTQSGVDYIRILRRLFSRFVWTEKTCSPIDILVKLSQGISQQYIENLIHTTRSLLHSTSPDRQFKVDFPSRNDDVLRYHIGCEESKGMDSPRPLPSGLNALGDGLILDLNIPGVTTTSAIQTILPDIMPGLQAELSTNNFATFNLNMKTPPNQSQSYVPVAQQEVISALQQYFRNQEIMVNSQPVINPQGKLTDIKFKISLKSLVNGRNFGGNIIPVDSMEENDNIIFNFRTKIVNSLPRVITELQTNTDVSFTVTLKPSKRTNERSLKHLQNILLTQLMVYFPYLETSVKSKADSNQVLFEVRLHKTLDGQFKTNIQPKRRNDDLQNIRYPDEFTMELLESNTPIYPEIMKIIPKIFNMIGNNLDRSHTIQFIIKPPRNSKEEDVPNISYSIIDYISEYFPDFYVDSITNGIKGVGQNIRDIKLELVLIPGKIPVTGSLAGQSPTTLEIQVPTKTEGLLNMIDRWVQSNMQKILALLKKKPIVLKLSVQPPKMATKEYEIFILKGIKELILNKFPGRNIRFDISGIQDRNGMITEAILLVTIEQIIPEISQPSDTVSRETYTPQSFEKTKLPRMIEEEMDTKPGIEKWQARNPTQPDDSEKVPEFNHGGTNYGPVMEKFRPENHYDKNSVINDWAVTQPPTRKPEISEKRTYTPPEWNKRKIFNPSHPDSSEKVHEFNNGGTNYGPVTENNRMINPSGPNYVMNDWEATQPATETPEISEKRTYTPPVWNERKTINPAYPDYSDKVHEFNNGGTNYGPVTEKNPMINPTGPNYVMNDWKAIPPATDKPEISEKRRYTPPVWNERKTINPAHPDYSDKVNEFNDGGTNYGPVTEKNRMINPTGPNYVINDWVAIQPTTEKPEISEKRTYIPPVWNKFGTDNPTDSYSSERIKIPGISVGDNYEPKPIETDEWESRNPPGSNSLGVTRSPGTNFSPRIPEIPPMNLVINPEDVIETLVLPKLSGYKLDITNILKLGKPGDVPYIIRFPKGIDQRSLKGMEKMLINIFNDQFPNHLVNSILDVKERNGNSVSSAEIKMIIEPVKQEDIFIDSIHSTDDILKVIRQKLSPVVQNLKLKLNRDKKAGVILNVSKPNKQSPKFITDIIQTVDELMEKLFSDQEFHVDVDTNDTQTIKIIITLKTPASQKSSENNDMDFILTADGSEKSPTQRIYKSLDSIYPTLKPFVDSGRKVVLNVNTHLNPYSNAEPIEKIIDNSRLVLQQMFPNIAIGIKPYVKKDPNNRASFVQLDITLQLYTISGTSQIEDLTIDLSNPQLTMRSAMERILPKISNIVHSNQQKSKTLNLNIIPPKRSTKTFLHTVTDFLVPLLASSFCNFGRTWKTSTSADLEGFLTDIVLSTTFEQSANSEPGAMQCQDNVDIDLAKPGRELVKEIDRMSQKMYAGIQSVLSGGKTQTLNFKVRLPPRTNADYLEHISEALMKTLQNYFPYNQMKNKIFGSQSPDGYLLMAECTVTIQPEKNPLPPSLINIPLDTSHGGSISFYVENAIPQYMSQIEALLAQHQSLPISFSINPPMGVKDDYLKMVSSELMNTLHGKFINKKIHVQSKAAKNSRGELFKIIIVVTFS